MRMRRATIDDVGCLTDFLVALTQESPYTGGRLANPGHLHDELVRLLPLDTSGFFVAETPSGAVVGLIAWLLYPDLITGERCTAEACWYVQPCYRDGMGLALLEVAERWAESVGATRMQMLAPAARFGAVYARRGYVRTDCVFERRLQSCLG